MAEELSDDLIAFVESGVSIQVGTRDSTLVPEALRAVGARVSAERSEIFVYVPHATSARTLANLRDNGRIAVCFSRVEDHRTIQVKGRVLELEPAQDAERERIDAYRAEFAGNLAFVGLPPRLSFRISSWPCHRVRFAVETIWVQTPGPGAGDPLRARSTS